MKKIVYAFALAGMILTGLTMTSCQKEGPQGAQGETGAKGDKGDQGPKGDQGAIGTANVIYSDWLDVNFTNGLATIDALKLDSAVLNSGEIKVFINANTSAVPVVLPLPTSIPNDTFPPINIAPLFTLKKIHLSSNYNASTFVNESGLKSFQYRYILIPGAVKALGINWDDYSQVKAALRIH